MSVAVGRWMRRRLRVPLLVVLLTGPYTLAFFAGGYFDEPRLWAGLLACALVVGAAVTSHRPVPAAGPGRLALVGLALLAAWTAASVAWAPLSAAAVPDADRLLLYLAAFASALALLDTRTAVRALEPAVAFGSFAVVSYGLSERLLPGIFELDRDASALGRLSQPLTYWNGMGTIAALGFVAAARIAGDPARSAAVRAAAAAAGVPIGLGLYLSFSRGALAALAVGLLVLASLVRTRVALRALAITLAAGLLSAAVAAALDGVRALEGDLAARERDGAIMLAVLVICAVAVAVAQLALMRREGAPPGTPTPVGPRGRRLLVTAVVALAAAGFALTAAIVERQPALAPGGADTRRLASVETTRSGYWDVALSAFAEQPLRGVGAGGFQVEWLRDRTVQEPARDAHSLYLETAAELGLVGLLGLALFLGGVGWGGSRAYGRDPLASAGLAAGLAVWLVHAGVDWLWELPAVTLPALLMAAALLRTAEAPPVRAS